MKRRLLFSFFISITLLAFSQEEIITTGAERITAWAKHKEMKNLSPYKNLPWIQIGPLFNGGRIASIVGVPGNNNIVYASATVGGVWKTINAGTTWEPIFEDNPTQVIGDIEVCPTNPDLVWVGTGSSNLSRAAYPGLGVFKSIDGGKSWEHKGLEESQHVMRIAIAPDNPNIVFVASMPHKIFTEQKNIGLFKTTDGGDTWEKVLSGDKYTGCNDVVFHPENSNIIYATSWNREKTIGHIYKSTDGGSNWVKLINGFPDGYKIGRIGIDISLSNPDVLYAYLNNHNTFKAVEPSENTVKKRSKTKQGLTLNEIRKMSSKEFLSLDSVLIADFLRTNGIIRSFGVNEIKEFIANEELTMNSFTDCIENYWTSGNQRNQNASEIGGEVYKTEDGGETWHKTNASPLYLLSSFGWSFCDIKISPENENNIYILGVTLQHSVDGGKTFQPNEGNQVHIIPNISKFLHLDQHDMWIDPLNPKRILLGNDGGTFISYDEGLNWMHHNTIPIGMFYKLSVDMETPYNIYGGTQDDSHVYGPSTQNLAFNTAESWKYVWLDRWSGGDGMHIMPDLNDPNTVYYESQNGVLRRKNLKENTNVFIQPERDFCEPKLRTDWSTPFYVSPTSTNTIYYGANKLFKSTDKGDNWTAISPDLTKKLEKGKKQTDRLLAIAIDDNNPKLIYTGSVDGELNITTDGGKTWNNISDKLPNNRINSIHISKYGAGKVYIVMSGTISDRNPYVFISRDFGNSWISAIGNLPLEKTRCIVEDPVKPNLLYLGTELGVYVSFNNGDEWFSLSNGLPAVSAEDLLIHPREHDLVIATYGRGIYKMDISVLEQMSTEIKEKGFHLFKVEDASLPKRRDYGGDWFFETAKFPEFLFYLNQVAPITVEIENNAGEIIKTFKLAGESGINRIEWDLIKEKAKYSKSAYKGGTSLYEAGNYLVRLKHGSKILEVSFNLKNYLFQP